MSDDDFQVLKESVSSLDRATVDRLIADLWGARPLQVDCAFTDALNVISDNTFDVAYYLGQDHVRKFRKGAAMK